MVIALDHFLHGSDLGGCQSCRLASRPAGSIVKLAANLGAAPFEVTRRRQTRDPQRHTQRYYPTRSIERPSQLSCPIVFGKPLVLQPALRYAKHRDQQAAVLAPSGALAEAFSTALLILVPEEGLALLEDQGEVEALLIEEDGSAHATSGWARAVAFESFLRESDGSPR
jgi:hypothetical protein